MNDALACNELSSVVALTTAGSISRGTSCAGVGESEIIFKIKMLNSYVTQNYRDDSVYKCTTTCPCNVSMAVYIACYNLRTAMYRAL